MAGKYYQRINSVDYDLTTLCEPKVHDAAPGFGTEFEGETFQKAGTDTENITLDGYTVDGSAITTVKNGRYPSFSKTIWFCGTAGIYELKRTDSILTIGSSTFYPSDFRGGVIPSEFIVLVVGAGAGGGGCGYFSPKKDKSGFSKIAGGAGGGGGAAIGRIKLTGDTKATIFVGSGGKAGTSGSSSSRSSGGTGGEGDSSVIYGPDGNAGLYGTRSYGGTGGKPSGDDAATAGTGGVGGHGELNSDNNNKYFVNVQFGKGGKGNYYRSHTNTACEALEYLPTSNTGATSKLIITKKTNNASTENKDDGVNSYYSGGCSYGFGKFFTSSSTIGNGGAGGGGVAGTIVSAGNAGYVEIWY